MEIKQIDKLYGGCVILHPDKNDSCIEVFEIPVETTKYGYLADAPYFVSSNSSIQYFENYHLEKPIHIEDGFDIIYSKEKEKAIQFVKNIVLKQKEECQKTLNLLDSVDLDNLLKEEAMLQNEPER